MAVYNKTNLYGVLVVIAGNAIFDHPLYSAIKNKLYIVWSVLMFKINLGNIWRKYVVAFYLINILMGENDVFLSGIL